MFKTQNLTEILIKSLSLSWHPILSELRNSALTVREIQKTSFFQKFLSLVKNSSALENFSFIHGTALSKSDSEDIKFTFLV